MKLLPAQTKPFTSPITRRHVPPEKRYGLYRSCLRWDFGFTCALCLTHESDLVPAGAERTGVFTVEHVIPKNPKTGRPSLARAYKNLVLACKLCNDARGTKATQDKRGRQLLDPTKVSWADVFVVIADELRPRDASNVHAQYTAEAYDFADPTKKEARRLRRRLITGHLRKILELPEKLDVLLERAEATDDPALAREILQFVKEHFDTPALAREDLEKCAAIPRDAPPLCLCDARDHHSLPPQLEAQLLEV